MFEAQDPHVPNLHAFIHPSVLGLNGDEKELQHYVSRLPASDTAFVCAKLNLLSSELMREESRETHQTELLAWLCQAGWMTAKDRDALSAHLNRNPGEFLLGRPSLLELIRWLAIWGDGNACFAYSDVRRQDELVPTI